MSQLALDSPWRRMVVDASIVVVFSCSSKLKFRYFRHGKRVSDGSLEPRFRLDHRPSSVSLVKRDVLSRFLGFVSSSSPVLATDFHPTPSSLLWLCVRNVRRNLAEQYFSVLFDTLRSCLSISIGKYFDSPGRPGRGCRVCLQLSNRDGHFD